MASSGASLHLGAAVENLIPARFRGRVPVEFFPASVIGSLRSVDAWNSKLLARAPFGRAAATPRTVEESPLEISSAADVVMEFYDGINRRDLEAVEELIGEGCVYEDLIFSKPFVGKKDILEFFKNFTEAISSDLQFVVDDISDEDSSAVGVTWHLDWQGRSFPFSKGCSFYRLELINGRRKIVYARDCVEPAIKPGETALVIVRGVTWLLQQFPWLANQL